MSIYSNESTRRVPHTAMDAERAKALHRARLEAANKKELKRLRAERRAKREK